ncbi:MAG: hypothetical protein OEM52_01235 [bacterium]|nr:hypothetical protein [bacterium]
MVNNTRLTVIATDLSAHGEGVFRNEGRVGFVPGLLPGESGEIDAVITGNVWRGTLRRRLSDAPERTPHPCPHADKCPGSRYGCIERSAELSYKHAHAQETLKRIGGIEWEIEPPITEGPAWEYRNKIELSVSSGQNPKIGYHPTNNAALVVPVNDCMLAMEPLRQLYRELLVAMRNDIKQLPALLARISLRVGDGMHLHFTTRENLPVAVKTQLSGFFHEYPGLVGISSAPLSRDSEKNAASTTHTIAGELLLSGDDGIAIHPLTFRQVNDAGAKAMVNAVEVWSRDITTTMFDLYGGYGPFARRIAKSGTEVLVLERSVTAIQDGTRAQKKVKLPIQYFGCDVVKDFPTIEPALRPDGILLDPAYDGAGAVVMKEILRRKPRKIAYIACHGAALARDLKILLASERYQLTRIRLYDMFPRTPDLEWFAELERK